MFPTYIFGIPGIPPCMSFMRAIIDFIWLPVTIFINIVRVVSLVLVYEWFAIDLSEGMAHTVSGLVLFLLGLWLLVFFQRILESWEAKNKRA